MIDQSVDRYIVTWTNGTNPIQTVTVNETSYHVTGLTPNTTYTVTVAAVNKYNCTGPSTDTEVNTTASISMDTASNTSVVISIYPTTATAVNTTIADTIGHTTTTTTTTDSTTTSSIATTTTTILMAATTSTAINSTTTIDSSNVMLTVTSTANVTSKFS